MMAWEWSHTDEAYVNAERNVRELPRAELIEILREWAYQDRADRNTIRVRRSPRSGPVAARRRKPAGFRLPNGVRRLPTDILADLVWTRASEHRTCTTGGHSAYVCPDGCHLVSFDRPGDDGDGD